MCTGTRLLTRVAPTQVSGCADGEVGWRPTGQEAGHSKGWRGHRPAGRGAQVTRSRGREESSPRARTAGSGGLYPVTLQIGVGEVVVLREPALGVRRNHYPESYLPRRCRSLGVKREEWGTNLNLRPDNKSPVSAARMARSKLGMPLAESKQGGLLEGRGEPRLCGVGSRWVSRSR